MLRSIQLENFKAFGQRTFIPLAPITLIFGQNCAGKSSILQSLNLLKQTRESRDVEALLLPRTESGFVDLGGFQELLFDHDLSRTLSIRLDMTLDNDRRERHSQPRFLNRTNSVGLELAFSRKTAKDEITLEGFKFCCDDLSGHVARFEKTEMPRDMRRYSPMSYRTERRREASVLRATRCVGITDEQSFWQHPYEWTSRERQRLIEMLSEARGSLRDEKAAPRMRGLFDEEGESTELHNRLLSKLEEMIRFLSSDFNYGQYVGWMVQEQADTIVALDGFIPVLSGRSEKEQGIDYILNRSLDRPSFRRDWSPDVGLSAVFAGHVMERTLAALFPLGPFRKPPSRWYIFTGTTPQDVGYQGHLLPDLLFRQPELRANTNHWLQKLEIGYEIKIRPLGSESADLFEFRLLDNRRNPPIEVGLSDVGFGISQILPLVVQSLAASDQIISVEQPEVHIHPRLQADLGDLLIEAIQEPRRNQFIIETHSEHLALRLQRRVREKKLVAEGHLCGLRQPRAERGDRPAAPTR